MPVVRARAGTSKGTGKLSPFFRLAGRQGYGVTTSGYVKRFEVVLLSLPFSLSRDGAGGGRNADAYGPLSLLEIEGIELVRSMFLLAIVVPMKMPSILSPSLLS